MSLGRGFTVWQHQEAGQFDRRSEPASGGVVSEMNVSDRFRKSAMVFKS
jgi:hypothetical protein